MSQLGPVGVALSVVFALFMTVLFVELYYVWWSRQQRRTRLLAGEARRGSEEQSATTVKPVQWKWILACPQMVLCTGGSRTPEELKRSSAKMLLCWRPQPAKAAKLTRSDAVEAEEGGCKAAKGEAQQQEGQEEEEEEEDLLKLVGLWGPPRLLFTIREETKEEMEEQLEEEAVRRRGKGSRRASRASSELLFASSSCCTSPFVTPPSSPPFATPFGSPAPPFIINFGDAPHAPSIVTCCNVTNAAVVEVESASCSTSSSSPPALGLRGPLSALFEDTSSFSPSSSSPSSATPHAALSPSSISAGAFPSFASNKRQRHPFCLLLDPLPPPSSALYHHLNQNRVHPLITNTSGSCNLGNGKPSLEPSPSLPLVNPEPPAPLRPFHLPAPSQPTTPCPFRPSLHAKQGVVASPILAVHSNKRVYKQEVSVTSLTGMDCERAK